MTMTIETIQPHRIAYLRKIGPYGPNNAMTMEALKIWARKENLLDPEAIILGIAQDDPTIMPPEHCRYDACIVIDNGSIINESTIQVGHITGGKYAVFTIEHTTEAVQKAWATIFMDLVQAGLRIDPSRPIIERYASKMVAMHQCEICVPICDQL